MNIIVTGSSKGIGLELTSIALKQGHHVLAVARNPQDSELMDLTKRYSESLELLALDITDLKASNLIVDRIKAWTHLDLLINNAGVYLGDKSVEEFLESFHVNTVAPFLITRALFQKLKSASAPKVVCITSLMGSISDNQSGGNYSYRSSKAALNMIVKSLSVDETWLTSVAIHPGWVRTRMGGEAAPITAQESVKGIWNVIQQLNLTESGLFFDYRKNKLAW